MCRGAAKIKSHLFRVRPQWYMMNSPTLTKALTHAPLETFLHLKHNPPALQWASHGPDSGLSELSGEPCRQHYCPASDLDRRWCFLSLEKANTPWRNGSSASAEWRAEEEERHVGEVALASPSRGSCPAGSLSQFPEPSF